jgi:hypothetical protein
MRAGAMFHVKRRRPDSAVQPFDSGGFDAYLLGP